MMEESEQCLLSHALSFNSLLLNLTLQNLPMRFCTALLGGYFLVLSNEKNI
jgi:hypothetical protein